MHTCTVWAYRTIYSLQSTEDKVHALISYAVLFLVVKFPE